MNQYQIKEVIKQLKAKKVKFEQGLSDHEIHNIEHKFNLTFPPDLRDFLQTQLPVSNSFVNWRLGLQSEKEATKIRQTIDWVFEGLAFDIRHNMFWLSQWGTKSDNIEQNIAVAKKHFQSYPKMIPIASHRYIPSQPNKVGNPVFSIYQTDIIYYGYDLAHYLANEFGFTLSDSFPVVNEPRYIKFWGDIQS